MIHAVAYYIAVTNYNSSLMQKYASFMLKQNKSLPLHQGSCWVVNKQLNCTIKNSTTVAETSWNRLENRNGGNSVHLVKEKSAQ